MSSLVWVGPLLWAETTYKKSETPHCIRTCNTASGHQEFISSSTQWEPVALLMSLLFLLLVAPSAICQADETGLKIFKWRTSRGSYLLFLNELHPWSCFFKWLFIKTPLYFFSIKSIWIHIQNIPERSKGHFQWCKIRFVSPQVIWGPMDSVRVWFP